MYVLNGLPVLPEHVHSNHCFVKFRIERLNDLVIQMLLILQSIKSFKHKFKQSVEVIRARGGNKDIGVPKSHRPSNSQSQGCRFPFLGQP